MNELIDLAKKLLPNKKEESPKEEAFAALISTGVSSPDGFAKILNISHDEADAIAYKLLVDFFSKGASAGSKKEVDPKEFNKGMEIETEHTDNPYIAQKIVRDHLAEIDNYYTRLEKMENEPGTKREY